MMNKPNSLLADLLELTPAERIQLAEDLWDSVGASPENMPGLTDAQLEEIEADGPQGHFEGLTLFLYNPQSHQWSLNWANAKNGTLAVPTIGSFNAKNGRGEFYDQEVFNGRMILVRYLWSDITPTSARFEQSFSDDGGKTWEPNWISTQTRVEK